MHFVISYDLSAEGTRRAEIEARIEDILSPFQHAKRLTTFYIVRIGNQSEWEIIRNKMNSLSNEIPEELHFIMSSPNKEPGKYNGILYRGDWDEINKITLAP